MDSQDIKTLREEIRHLKLQIDDLKAAQNMDRSETIKAISEINQHLWPVVFEVFPSVAKSMKQIDDVLKTRGASSSESWLKVRKLDGDDKTSPGQT